MYPRLHGWGFSWHLSQGSPQASPSVAQHRARVHLTPVRAPIHWLPSISVKQGPTFSWSVTETKVVGGHQEAIRKLYVTGVGKGVALSTNVPIFASIYFHQNTDCCSDKQLVGIRRNRKATPWGGGLRALIAVMDFAYVDSFTACKTCTTCSKDISFLYAVFTCTSCPAVLTALSSDYWPGQLKSAESPLWLHNISNTSRLL